MEETIRSTPQNIEAEQSVLSALLLNDQRALDEVINILTTDDFYRESHRVMFRCILELHQNGKAVDQITLIDALRTRGKLDDVGGISYVSSVAGMVPTTANVKYHANIVHEKAALRKMIEVGTEITRMGYEPDSDDIQSILDRAETKMLEVATDNKYTDFQSMQQLVGPIVMKLSEMNGKKGGLLGIPTDIYDFDNMTSGLQKGDFIILAARPSMGKTALALNIAANVALKGHKRIGGNPLKVAIFSLEMSKEQLVNRMLCAEASIDSQRLRIGELNADEWDRIWSFGNLLSQARIFIDDTGGLSCLEIRSRARRLQATEGLDLIVIDYLQLMRGSGRRASEDNRQAEVSEISRSLKALARELNIPIIALSQLSRAVESRTSKRPMLSDLRESGSLEQDADIVCFLYREDYYNPETEHKHITELIIAKHRNGATGTINLFFDDKYTKFRDMSNRPDRK